MLETAELPELMSDCEDDESEELDNARRLGATEVEASALSVLDLLELWSGFSVASDGTAERGRSFSFDFRGDFFAGEDGSERVDVSAHVLSESEEAKYIEKTALVTELRGFPAFLLRSARS